MSQVWANCVVRELQRSFLQIMSSLHVGAVSMRGRWEISFPICFSFVARNSPAWIDGSIREDVSSSTNMGILLTGFGLEVVFSPVCL